MHKVRTMATPRTFNSVRLAFYVLLVPILVARPVWAEDAPAASEWEFNIIPYLWMAGLNADVSAPNGRSASISRGFGQILNHLNAAVMLDTTARYQRWVAFADFEYSNLSAKSEISPLVGQLGLSSTSYLGTVAGGYRVIDSTAGTFDLLAGLRAISLHSSTNFSGGLLPAFTVRSSTAWVNPIGAVRGIVPLGGGFSLNGYGDVGGGGDDELTWQVYGGVSYSITPTFVAYLGYRYLSIRRQQGPLVTTLGEQGPLMAIGLRF